MGGLYRKVVLAIVGNRVLRSLMNRYGLRMGAGRFVAAETLEETIAKVQALNLQGFAVTLDYLGESVTSRALSEESVEAILAAVEAIHAYGLDSHVSVKLTQLGLLIDEALCLRNMERIVEKAKRWNIFVRIDMEDSSVTESTLRIFHNLLDKYGPAHVGVAIQAYLYRTEQDMRLLGRKKANVRMVKGAYSESPAVAYSAKRDVDRRYVRLVREHLLSGAYAAIATHDRRMVEPLIRFTKTNSIPLSRFEFQMLYGIAEDLQLELQQAGYRVRIYTPFGKNWYAYFTRRIAERPANLLFVLKGILSGRKAGGAR